MALPPRWRFVDTAMLLVVLAAAAAARAWYLWECADQGRAPAPAPDRRIPTGTRRAPRPRPPAPRGASPCPQTASVEEAPWIMPATWMTLHVRVDDFDAILRPRAHTKHSYIISRRECPCHAERVADSILQVRVCLNRLSLFALAFGLRRPAYSHPR